MCGIVGYTGSRSAAPVLFKLLQKLEYRGYDSAGISVIGREGLQTYKRAGKVENIAPACRLTGNMGIGHTRWATHGKPSDENAHPHVYGKCAVVHNGIIENSDALKKTLSSQEKYNSQTDSEVIAHLIAHAYRGDLLSAVHQTVIKLQGSFAIATIWEDEPQKIVCARGGSPLVVGRRKGESLVASDLTALSAVDEAFVLEDGEYAVLENQTLAFYDAALNPIQKEPIKFDSVTDCADKKGYRHYMQKEMAEIPAVLSRTVLESADKSTFDTFYRVLCQAEYIHIVACGTAYHSALCAKYAIEALCRIPVEACIASEYRYRNPIIGRNTLVIAVSQSGETADTLAAAALAKERGAYLTAITNVAYSSLTRLADCVFLTNAGAEIAVAATKSFNAQLALLYSVALLRSGGSEDFSALASLAEKTLLSAEAVRSWTPYFLGAKCAYFIGRGVDYCTALEGSLKLKEISYLPSEGYPAGELKHGTLALVEPNTPVVALLTQRSLAEKTMNAVHEIKSRGARVFLITSIKEFSECKEATAEILLPQCREIFSPILSVIPLQALAYYTSIARGNDPDKPRNLAKSVTVE